MKKVLTMALLLTLLLASCGTTKVVSTKKLPVNATNAVKRAQNVAGALKTMNLEIPFEEHAYLIMTDSFQIEGLSGRIGVYPPGEHFFRFKSPYFSLFIRELLSKQITVSFEAGEYYSYNAKNTMLSLGMGSLEFYVVADEVKLEQAKQDLAGIKEYLEYSKNHPNALDGTYKMRNSTLVIKEGRLYLTKDSGLEFLYDGETIVFIDDGKVRSYDYNVWYYRFNDEGNLEIITNTGTILKGHSNTVLVFKPVPPS